MIHASFGEGSTFIAFVGGHGGYRFLSDQIIAIDGLNPSVAARMLEPLSGWARLRPELAALMRAELNRVVEHRGLSKNVQEVANKALGR